MHRLRCALGLLAFLAAAVPLQAQSTVDTVDVTPALDTVLINQAVSLQARIVNSAGLGLNKSGTWTVRDTSALRPASRGTVRASTGRSTLTFRAKADTGRSYVVYTSGSKKDSALIIVRDTACTSGVLATLDVRPDSAVLRYKDTTSVVALARDNCGALLPGGVNITWASTSTGDATVSALDSLIGRIVVVDSSGTAYIRGTSGSVKDSAKILLRGNPGT